MSKGNKHKKQGTTEERRQLNLLRHAGFPGQRLAEGGSNDEGDLKIEVGTTHIIVESKHRDRLPIHEAVQKAEAKAFPYESVIWWKRTTLKKGNKQRSQVGEPIVCMSEGFFLELLWALRYQLEEEASNGVR